MHRLEVHSSKLALGIESAAKKHGIGCHVGCQGSLLGHYLTKAPVKAPSEAMSNDREIWKRFFHGVLELGVHLPPSPFEAWYVSSVHDDAIVERVVKVAHESFARVVA